MKKPIYFDSPLLSVDTSASLIPTPASGRVILFSEGGQLKQKNSSGSVTVLGTSSNVSDNETPTGTIDGVNVTFTLLHTPINGSLKLYYNGQRMKNSVDFTISGSTITFVSAPITGWILADYTY